LAHIDRVRRPMYSGVATMNATNLASEAIVSSESIASQSTLTHSTVLQGVLRATDDDFPEGSSETDWTIST
jgi:hypothetical protein